MKKMNAKKSTSKANAVGTPILRMVEPEHTDEERALTRIYELMGLAEEALHALGPVAASFAIVDGLAQEVANDTQFRRTFNLNFSRAVLALESLRRDGRTLLLEGGWKETTAEEDFDAWTTKQERTFAPPTKLACVDSAAEE